MVMAEPGRWIPVSAPALGARETEYVLECMRSTWISSSGQYIERFEAGFKQFCGTEYAVACNSGTAALHLSMLAVGISPGDEVIVPTLTYVASANAVRYCGATPRFVDSLPDTWNLDPEDVKRKITPNTRAIMPVHLYGEPADMEPLLDLADEHELSIIEDAAQAHGAEYVGGRAGSLGRIATFSFYGNKIITTGEGGMVVTNDGELARKALLFRGQGQDFDRRYWFPVIGYNYRMTNIEAAIGLAQLETIEERLARRQAIAQRYRANLVEIRGLSIQGTGERSRSANWMVGVVLPVASAVERDQVAMELRDAGVDTRPFFYPIHTMPPYAADDHGSLPVAIDLAARGICLPTWEGLGEEDIDYICERLVAALGR